MWLGGLGREVGGFSLLVWFGGNRFVVWLLVVWCGMLRVKFNCGGSWAGCCKLEGQLACWSSRRAESWGQGLAARALINRPL
jgi:hypothetical protein